MPNFLQIFYGKIINGKFAFNDRSAFDRAVSFMEGQEAQITLDKRKKPRSDKENKYYHGVVLKMLAETWGYNLYDKDEMETLAREVKKKCLGTYKKGPFEIVRGTRGLSTVEMEEFLANVRRWAATEHNIQIPEPNEVDYRDSDFQ